MQADRSTNRAAWIVLGLILLGTVTVYLPSLGGEFVYDDERFIRYNTALRELSNLPEFFTDPATMTASHGQDGWDDIYRPLRTLSFAVSLRWFGLSPFAFRLENLLWHLAAVACAFLLTRRLLRSTGAAFVAAGYFALHPMQVEAAGWVSSRGDLMAAVFLLGAALALLRERPSLRAVWGGLLLFVLALFSKESAIAFVAVVPLYDYCFRVKVDRRRVGLYSGLLVIGLLFLALRFNLTTGQMPFGSHTFASTGSAVGVLGLQTVLPVRIFPYTGDILTPEAIASSPGLLVFVLCVLALAVALVRGRKNPELAFGFLFAAVCLLPVSGIVPIKAPASARFAYLPILGVGLMLGALLRGRGRLATGLTVLAFVALGALSAREAGTWRSDLVLWERAVARAEASLGRAGEVALANLGLVRAQGGDLRGARSAMEKSLRVRSLGETRLQLGMVLLRLGDRPGAVQAVRQALAEEPENRQVQLTAGIVLGQLGLPDEELRAYERAVEMAPGFAAARARLGMALLIRGDAARAVEHLRIAARGSPGSAQPHLDLARALHACGRTGEAMEALDRAASLETENPLARANLGITLLELGRPDDAVPLLQEAVTNDPASFILCYSLARAQAAVGQRTEARRSAQKALALAGSRDQAARAEALLAWLR